MTTWTPPNKDHPPPKAGEPPLHKAARLGDHAEIRRLIAAGADPNATFDIALDPGGREHRVTPLMIAAGSGDGATVETVKLLMELGADPKLTLADVSAAEHACTGLGWNYRPGGDADRLACLLDAGSPLTLAGSWGSRLVAGVARAGDVTRLRVLLDRGADPNPQWTEKDVQCMSEPLEDLVDPDEDTVDPFADLDPDVRAYLAEVQTSVEASMEDARIESATRPVSWCIPLFGAVEGDSVECVRLLLERGADARIRDSQQRTAVFEARSEGVIGELLAAGLSLEDRDDSGWTPLNALRAAGDDAETALERVRLFIRLGADVNATYDRGYTIFMSAVGAMERDVGILRALVEGGANPHAVSELGYNAFHAAIDVDFGANEEESVRETLTYLREIGVDIEHRNNAGETPLARAINDGTETEVRVLLELGADPNCRASICKDGACYSAGAPAVISAVGDPEKLALLIKHGADPRVTDEDGRTALSYARDLLAEAVAKEDANSEWHQTWIDRLHLSIQMLENALGGASDEHQPRER